jgi:hypothetical protein
VSQKLYCILNICVQCQIIFRLIVRIGKAIKRQWVYQIHSITSAVLLGTFWAHFFVLQTKNIDGEQVMNPFVHFANCLIAFYGKNWNKCKGFAKRQWHHLLGNVGTNLEKIYTCKRSSCLFRYQIQELSPCVHNSFKAEQCLKWTKEGAWGAHLPARGSGERCELPQWGLGQSPAANAFWWILSAICALKIIVDRQWIWSPLNHNAPVKKS